MAGSEVNIEHCLVCGSLLTSGGQCPSCDAVKIKKSTAVADIDSQKNKILGQQAEFQSAEQGRSRLPSPAFLFNKETKERFELSQTVSKVGRDHSNNISLPSDHYISRYHAWVFHNKGRFWVEDLESTNGTLINGRPITIRTQLTAGDRVTFGKTELIFVID